MAWKKDLSTGDRARLTAAIPGKQTPRAGNAAVQYVARLFGTDGKGPRAVCAEELRDEEKAVALLGTRRVDARVPVVFFADPMRMIRDVLKSGPRPTTFSPAREGVAAALRAAAKRGLLMDAYLLSAVRTPIGKFLGGLADVAAPRLGAVAVKEAVARAGVRPADVDEVILGNVVQAGVGQAPARQAAIHAGLPGSVPAVTVNMVCGSGLKAVMQAAQAVRAGDAGVIVAGGMESMSNAPFLLPKVRAGYKYGDQTAVDALVRDGLWCAFENWPMGAAAEHTASTCGIGRADQDAFAAESHRRAAAAWERGDFADEVVPVTVGAGAKAVMVSRDEGIRPDTTAEGLARLKPAFRPDGGTVTAGNASQLSDGAAAVVVASADAAGRLGAKPLARVVAWAASGVAPKDIFLAPVPAVRAVLAKAKLNLADVDLIELNEAFASQVLACGDELKLDPAKLNVHGGAVALGHPIGASGARVLVTLVHALRKRGGRYGLASLCLGGGNAVAVVVERV